MKSMLKESDFVKLRISVPTTHTEEILRVLGEAGAGVQGRYDHCSCRYRQIGRFRPLTGAQPTIGTVGEIEQVEEDMIETLCHKDILASVLAAVKVAHPYEEPGIDIMPRYELE